MTAKFDITNGTTTIDMLNPGFGLHIEEWQQSPQELTYVQGGGYAAKVANIYVDVGVSRQTITYRGNELSQDRLTDLLRTLRSSLYKATKYATVGSNVANPWYVRIKANRETNYTYARILRVEFDDGHDIVSTNFTAKKPFTQSLTVVLELADFTSHAPGQVATGSIEHDYEDSYKAIPNSIGEQIVIANFNTGASPLIHAWSNSDGVYTTNYATDNNNSSFASPVQLFQSGRYQYFAYKELSGDNGNPFAHLRFSVSTAFNLSDTGNAYQYWNGSSWAALETARGSGDLFGSTGIKHLYWYMPTDWVYPYIMRVVASSSPSTKPRIDEPVVSAGSNRILVDATGGDIEPFLDVSIENQSVPTNYKTSPYRAGHFNELHVATRSFNRGYVNTFLSVDDAGLPAATYQPYSGITSSVIQAGRTVGNRVMEITMPTSAYWQSNQSGGALGLAYTDMLWDSSFWGYAGVWRAFLLVSMPADSTADVLERGMINWRVSCMETNDDFFDSPAIFDTTNWATDAVRPPNSTTNIANGITMLELGNLTVPSSEELGSTRQNLRLSVEVLYGEEWTNAGADRKLWLHGVVLMPVDECYIHFYTNGFNTMAGQNSTYLYLQSATYQGLARPAIKYTVTGETRQVMSASPDTPLVGANDEQFGIYFLSAQRFSAADSNNPTAINLRMEPDTSLLIRSVDYVNRYLGSRGTG